MGYDLHITRKEFWADEDVENSISRLEWQEYLKADSEITDDPENPHEDNYLYIRDGGNWPLWFNPRLGNIDTKNPEVDVIKKMVRIANALGAQVRGDDDELYDLNGDIVPYKQETSPLIKENTDTTYNRYVWYFAAIVFVTSIIWNSF